MVYVFLADGFEEIEALTPVDVLRRANIPCKTVGVMGKTATGTHGITVECDIKLSELSLTDLSAVLLPGGMPGADNLKNSAEVISAVKYAAENGKLIAAICAAPYILGEMGLLKNKKATCFPGFEDRLEGADYTAERVEVSGNIITARGAGCAMQFAAAIIGEILDKNTADSILKAMQY